MVYELTAPGTPGPVRAPDLPLPSRPATTSRPSNSRAACAATPTRRSPVRDMCVLFHYRDPTHFYYVHFAGIERRRPQHHRPGRRRRPGQDQCRAGRGVRLPPDGPRLARVQGDLRRPDRGDPGLPRRHDGPHPDGPRPDDRPRPRRRRLVRRHRRLRRPGAAGFAAGTFLLI